MTALDRNILCMKYGRAYSADYVNVLYNASRAALSAPARFVCLTDDAAGLAPGIEAFPIPDIGLEPQEWFRPGVWPKIGLFDAAIHGLRGRALFIDLDMVIARDLDAFFDMPGAIIGTDAGPGWGRSAVRMGAAAPEFGSMIFAFDLGQHSDIADRFRADKAAVWAACYQEQQYIHACRPDARFWPDGWVVSFKRALRRPIGIDLLLPPLAPPAGVKVVAFHGKPRPADLLRPGHRFWDRFPHLGNGPVPWFVDYWRENGGRLPDR
jgi:hypothetical protein